MIVCEVLEMFVVRIYGGGFVVKVKVGGRGEERREKKCSELPCLLACVGG